MSLLPRVSVAAALLATGVLTDLAAQTKNGFDLSNATIDPGKILSGGPPRDGIPSIDAPRFVKTAKVTYLREDDIVIGLKRGETARAYPLRILVWHEIVNDVIEEEPVAVTYCPLCGTAMAFDRRLDGETRSFGVSGLLFQSDVLMYDRERESLWSQLAMKSVSGPDAGMDLTWLPSEHLTWKAWREKHPEGKVLSPQTGFNRPYGKTAYASYFASDETMFPVPHRRVELPNKTWVLGVILNGEAKAYPVDRLPADAVTEDDVGGQRISIRYDPKTRHPRVTGEGGGMLPSVMVFWFAWQAFYPGTGLWQP